ncbi:MAG TPA: hypothetical protein VGJ79_00620 [Candidatus Dormibacteraeota bacterium]|jgi:hypothetical protein
METETITVDREEAAAIYRKYREHQHYSTPIDREVQRVYEAIAKKKIVVQALASIVKAGLGEDGLPKLAIVRADSEKCHLQLRGDGGARFSKDGWAPDRNRRTYIDLPPGSFPASNRRFNHYEALTPLVPIHIRPQRALENYHILFEAEWSRVVPKDPLLLRRLSKGDLWVVIGAWDLTDVERAVLAGRL